MLGEYPSQIWPSTPKPKPEQPKDNVIHFQPERAKPGSYEESMSLLGFDSIADAQRARNNMAQDSDEYKKLNKLIRLAITTAHQENIQFEDLDTELRLDRQKKKAA